MDILAPEYRIIVCYTTYNNKEDTFPVTDFFFWKVAKIKAAGGPGLCASVSGLRGQFGGGPTSACLPSSPYPLAAVSGARASQVAEKTSRILPSLCHCSWADDWAGPWEPAFRQAKEVWFLWRWSGPLPVHLASVWSARTLSPGPRQVCEGDLFLEDVIWGPL